MDCRDLFFACDLLEIVATFLGTSPRRFYVIRNQKRGKFCAQMFLSDSVLVLKIKDHWEIAV